ncbi:carboxylesterase/lipase family protein [Microbacterium sp. SLBN-146]|uniref:carboxylesterase/lipase family protein n=1 Tax=Microbacterium sp. SLBN-146 TaxID=2768457 RepID=UPI0011707595|nr:carboxylesterase/lipase family protein [Microbacterium sp. SLBN-146]TQJ32104.1 para-nitrobenzyl esterase [Microbacterium sp. SLBN-146]
MDHIALQLTPAEATCLAVAPSGTFRGRVIEGVRSWRGIRFGESPGGALRWRDPIPTSPAEHEVDARCYGPVCPQRMNPAVPLGGHADMDENCLVLNVWSPGGPAEDPAPVTGGEHGSETLPVMVWLHGGAYTFGASSQPLFDATSMVTNGDVVVVTVNYRLGAFGFLDLAGLLPDAGFDRNLALKDVLLALRWVRDNISAFGGDAERVTVFGESAGAGLVTTLLATPSAEGLFHRAIAQSSPASSIYGIERARVVAERFVRAIGVTSDDPVVIADALRACSADDIVSAGMTVYADVPTEVPGTLAFAPVIDGDLLPESPAVALHEGRGLPVPLIIGTNKDEASLFRFMKSPLMPITDDRIQQMIENMRLDDPTVDVPPLAQIRTAYEHARHRAIGLGIARDIGFRMPTLWIAEGHARVADVWLYRFDHASPFLRLIGLGATHATELPYLWGNLDGGPKDPTFRLGGRRLAQAVSRRMQERWTSFAHGRTPDAADTVVWGRYRTVDGTGDGDRPRETLVIDHVDTLVSDPDASLRTAWGDEVLTFR